MINCIFNPVCIVIFGFIALLQSNIAAATDYRYSPDATRMKMEQQQEDIRRRQSEAEQRSQIRNMERWHQQMEINQRLNRAQAKIHKSR